jgi:hypothetical protein
MEKKTGSGINIPDHIFPRALSQFFGLKILKFLIADPGWKYSGPGSGKNIPDPARLENLARPLFPG